MIFSKFHQIKLVTLFPETKISVMHAEQLYTLQKSQLSRSRCHFFDRSPPLPINSIANQFDRVWMMCQQNVRTSNQFVKSFTRSCRPTIYELRTKWWYFCENVKKRMKIWGCYQKDLKKQYFWMDKYIYRVFKVSKIGLEFFGFRFDFADWLRFQV